MAARQVVSGSPAASALAVAALIASPAPLGGAHAQAPPHEIRPDVVISAAREPDAVLVAKVERALRSDPYLFVSHISVTAENGVVRLEGVVQDPFDLLQLLRVARHVAGKRRVINEIEVVSGGVDHD